VKDRLLDFSAAKTAPAASGASGPAAESMAATGHAAVARQASGSGAAPFRAVPNDISRCLRCGKTVYPTDKIGPLKDFTFFHSGCFRCFVCGSKLTLRTYCHSQASQDDKEVYCSTHAPRIGAGKFDGESLGIKTATQAPKGGSYVNEQIRPGGKAHFDADALAIRAQMREGRR